MDFYCANIFQRLDFCMLYGLVCSFSSLTYCKQTYIAFWTINVTISGDLYNTYSVRHAKYFEHSILELTLKRIELKHHRMKIQHHHRISDSISTKQSFHRGGLSEKKHESRTNLKKQMLQRT